MSVPQQHTSPALRGAVVAVALQWTLRAMGLVSIVVLARLLSPADFGIVGLAMSAVALVEIFSYVGLRQVLVRMPDPDRTYLDSAWTIQLLLFTLLGLVLASGAPLVAAFYGEPAVTLVVLALSVRFVLLGLVNIGIVDFDRNFQFGRDLAMRLVGRAASLLVAVAVALAFRSYWALVAGILTQAVCMTVLSYILHPYRPRMSLQRRTELIGVSLWIFVGLAAQVVQNQVDRIALGRQAGAESVGAFAVSKDLSAIFTHEIATALNRVSFVQTSRAGALEEQGARIGRLLGSYALVTAPLGLGIAAVADEFFAVFLGDQWSLAARLTVLLAPAGAAYAVYKLVASSLQAAGRERASALTTLAGMAGTIAAVVVAVYAGADAAMQIAAVTLVACVLTLLGGVAVIARLAHGDATQMLAQVARPFLAATLMCLCLGALSGAWPSASALALAAKVVVGMPLYVAALAALWWLSGRPEGAETAAASALRRVFGHLRRTARA